MKIFDYDIKKYPFRDLASGLYDKDLSELDSDDTKLDLTLGKDTATPFHKLFYERIDSGWPEFVGVYHSFLREVIHPMIEDDILYYQKYPGIRFSRPEAKAVYKWHSDGDSDHNHPIGEINIWFPITKSFGTNTMWCESIPGLGDWSPGTTLKSKLTLVFVVSLI